MSNSIEFSPFVLPVDPQPDMIVEEVYTDWLGRGKVLAIHEQRAYARELHTLVGTINNYLFCMSLTGATPEQMRQETSLQVVMLKNSAARFLSNRDTYVEAKREVSHSLTAFAQKVLETSQNFPPFTSPQRTQKTAREALVENLVAKERQELLDDMLVLRTSSVLSEAVMETVCGVHPKVQQACVKVGIAWEKGKKYVKDSLFTPEEQLQMQKREQSSLEKEARWHEQYLAIPRELTEQYQADRDAIAEGALLEIALLPLLRFPRKIPRPPLVTKEFPPVSHAINTNIKRIDWEAPRPSGVGVNNNRLSHAFRNFLKGGYGSGLPVIGEFHFDGKSLVKKEKHFFATGTPMEGFLNYKLVKGNGDSVLIYLDFIQKGRRYNWDPPSALKSGCTPYSTTRAGIEELIKIGQAAGGKRIFLQFEPVNSKFQEYVAKHYASKGEHPIHLPLCGEVAQEGPYTVYELTSVVELTRPIK